MMKKQIDADIPLMAQPKYIFLLRRLTRMFAYLALIMLLVVIVAGTAAYKKGDRSSNRPHQKKALTQNFLFVLGKDFYQYSELFTYLSKVYDPESLKQNIHILSYSEMIAKTRQPRLAMISERLAAQPVRVLISIGLPEGGARLLRTIKETYPDLHIFSLLPVEEILPLEAYSDAVIDFELPDSFTKADRAVNIPAHDIQTLILCTVTAAEQTDTLSNAEPFSHFARAVAAATDILEEHNITAWGGTPYTLHPYKDPELNIRSYNYLILSPSPTDRAVQSVDTEEYAAGEKP